MAVRRIRVVEEKDLDQILIWRNHPDIRRYMFTRQKISWMEHSAWFTSLQGDPTRHALLYEDNGLPLGVVMLTCRQGNALAEWGFYKDPGAAKGTGVNMGRLALSYAFDTLRLHRVYGKVIADNLASIELHRKLGFVQEGVLRDHFGSNDHFDSVLCFGLLDSEWTSQRELTA
ncbi:UDP-4-amino-4,6-dideoxy-N-acetyl-beta-L-altrosamine N-acetyltransferase [Pusillimonas sp. T2]|uniref:UDP-4-amino-4, 6-dideoxy-N-acetyl-beta-L-altrosamine N-acetyltransferase n=1 Tax=Pusillimonas sp. T2 TaxID=1548123 RepID=UPI000B9C9C37|nr:UDP-4-amino-4,6-dideoxy-N-acetyl-beta-L-altrosamine N-acetyltransferase [Pusillimonas sp. T2]